MRLVDPQQRLFQLGGGIKRAYAVVRQRAAQRIHKDWRKSLALGLDHPQISEQVSFGAGRFAPRRTLGKRIAPEERADVHKDAEDLVFLAADFRGIDAGVAELAPLGKRSRRLAGTDIEAQHQLAQSIQALTPACLLAVFVLGQRRAKNHTLRSADNFGVADCFDLHQRRAGIDLHVGDGHDLAHASGERSDHLRLHLHGFQHQQAIARRDHVSGLTAMDTTTAGAGACTTPPSSRSMRCETPSTSMR